MTVFGHLLEVRLHVGTPALPTEFRTEARAIVTDALTALEERLTAAGSLCYSQEVEPG